MVQRTYSFEELSNVWLPAFFAEQSALSEVMRLVDAAYRLGKKNARQLYRCQLYTERQIFETVEVVRTLGGLLFLGHNTKTAKAIKKAVAA